MPQLPFSFVAGFPVGDELNDGNGHRGQKQDVYEATLVQDKLQYKPNGK